jgi:hypothetical protein
MSQENRGDYLSQEEYNLDDMLIKRGINRLSIISEND